jgi:hypothetical protein
MKHYLLSIYQPKEGTPPPDVLEKVMRDVGALIDETKAAGAWAFNGGLEAPDAARVVRVGTGRAVVTDGPYIETKEFLGGLLVVKATDIDDALAWASRLAHAVRPLAIEVRPFHGATDDSAPRAHAVE